MTTNTTELTATSFSPAEKAELHREGFRQHCAELLGTIDNAARVDECLHRTRRAEIELKMLASYLEGQIFEDSALFGVECTIASLREAIEEHGRKIIISGIEGFATGRDITPAIRAEAISVMINAEPKHSPYQSVLVAMLNEANAELPDVMES